MGFEPTRAEHIGLAVQRLNHSATSSYMIICNSIFIQFGRPSSTSWTELRPSSKFLASSPFILVVDKVKKDERNNKKFTGGSSCDILRSVLETTATIPIPRRPFPPPGGIIPSICAHKTREEKERWINRRRRAFNHVKRT